VQCKALVVEYGPFVLANLDKILDSQALCCKAGFCKSAICPEKAKLWTETLAGLSQKDSPLIDLPHEGFTRSVEDLSMVERMLEICDISCEGFFRHSPVF